MHPVVTLAGIDNDLVKLVGIMAVASVVLGWVLISQISSVIRSKHREESRREIAAYVAEGSISPQDAALILSAGPDEFRKSVADGVAWGTISAKNAERLLSASARPERAKAT
jgi:hypothetical protein